MKPATLTDLMYAVTHDDEFDAVLMSSDVLTVLQIALIKKLGLTALNSPARIDLGNGHVLNIAVEGVTPKPEQMKFQVQELRPEVLQFALLMEARLREKDLDKAESWKNAEMQHLRVNMVAKASMLERALGGVEHGRPLSVAVTKHAVDLANYTMMIADVAGALEDTGDNGGAGWPGLDQVQMS